MDVAVWITIILLWCLVIWIVVNEIKYLKSLSEKDRIKELLLLLIIIFPITIFFLDKYDVISKYAPNLTINYDWLSFLGSYIGVIASAVFLLIITEKDREDNTQIIQKYHRPYLESYLKEISLKDIKDNSKLFISITDEPLRNNCFVICLKNNGESVAIINTKKSIIKNESKQIILGNYISTLSIKSGDEVYLLLPKNNSKISCNIKYSDLFSIDYDKDIDFKI